MAGLELGGDPCYHLQSVEVSQVSTPASFEGLLHFSWHSVTRAILTSCDRESMRSLMEWFKESVAKNGALGRSE